MSENALSKHVELSSTNNALRKGPELYKRAHKEDYCRIAQRLDCTRFTEIIVSGTSPGSCCQDDAEDASCRLPVFRLGIMSRGPVHDTRREDGHQGTDH